MMYTIEQLREIIKAELDKQEYVEEPYSLFEPIKYIMEDGGKRLRPVFDHCFLINPNFFLLRFPHHHF